MDNTFIVHSDWLEAIKELSTDQQDKIIADLVRYGCRIDTCYDDIPQINSYVKLLKGSIDFSVEKYNNKKYGGKSATERKQTKDEIIWELAHTKGWTAQAIANELGIGKSTVDHSPGWKQRNNDEFVGLQ